MSRTSVLFAVITGRTELTRSFIAVTNNLLLSILVLISLTALPSIAAGAVPSAAGSSKTGGAQNATGSQSQAGPTGGASAANPPFESVMLAYGALDQTMQALARRACLVVDPGPVHPGETAPFVKPTIVVIDQAALSNLQAYDSFDRTARYFRQEFEEIVSPSGAASLSKLVLAGAGPDDFADTTGAIAAALIAANTESASTITIQDISADIKLSLYLANDPRCKNKHADVFYPGMYGSDNASLTDTFKDLIQKHQAAVNFLAASICPAAAATSTGVTPAPAACSTPIANSLKATSFSTLDASYNQFLQSWFATNSSTGQSGLSAVLQGYALHKLLTDSSRTIYEVFLNFAAAGGTQQDRKNFLTALITGDWIRYSGGVVVNTMIIKGTGSSSTVLYADVLRYRTRLTHVRPSPIGKNATRYGDNLGDTCPNAAGECSAELRKQQ